MQVIVAESTDNFCNYIYFLQSKLGEMMMMMTKPSGGPIKDREGVQGVADPVFASILSRVLGLRPGPDFLL